MRSELLAKVIEIVQQGQKPNPKELISKILDGSDPAVVPDLPNFTVALNEAVDTIVSAKDKMLVEKNTLEGLNYDWAKQIVKKLDFEKVAIKFEKKLQAKKAEKAEAKLAERKARRKQATVNARDEDVNMVAKDIAAAVADIKDKQEQLASSKEEFEKLMQTRSEEIDKEIEKAASHLNGFSEETVGGTLHAMRKIYIAITVLNNPEDKEYFNDELDEDLRTYYRCIERVISELQRALESEAGNLTSSKCDGLLKCFSVLEKEMFKNEFEGKQELEHSYHEKLFSLLKKHDPDFKSALKKEREKILSNDTVTDRIETTKLEQIVADIAQANVLNKESFKDRFTRINRKSATDSLHDIFEKHLTAPMLDSIKDGEVGKQAQEQSDQIALVIAENIDLPIDLVKKEFNSFRENKYAQLLSSIESSKNPDGILTGRRMKDLTITTKTKEEKSMTDKSGKKPRTKN